MSDLLDEITDYYNFVEADHEVSHGKPVATDKAAVAADKAAALQALSEIQSLVLAAEANAAAASTPIAVIEGDQYSVGLVVSRGRAFLSVVPVAD